MCFTSGRSEADIIEEITSVILMRLNRKLLPIDKNFIGMDCCLEEIIPKMIDYQMMFAWLGFMDLEELVRQPLPRFCTYNRIAFHCMITSFIANIREDFKSQGLPYLQKQLLHDILLGRNKFISNVDEGIYMIKDKLCFKKVLLDDVDNERTRSLN